MKKISLLVAAAAMLTLAGCSVPPEEGARVLTSMGFTNIQVGGASLFSGCGRDDSRSASFTATGPTGIKVEGTLCSGSGFWGSKGTTVRFN